MLVKLKNRYACPSGNYRTGEVISVEEKIAIQLEKDGSEIVGKVEEKKIECAAIEPKEKAVKPSPVKKSGRPRKTAPKPI